MNEVLKNVKIVKRTEDKNGIQKNLLSNGMIIWKTIDKLVLETNNCYFNIRKNASGNYEYAGKTNK